MTFLFIIILFLVLFKASFYLFSKDVFLGIVSILFVVISITAFKFKKDDFFEKLRKNKYLISEKKSLYLFSIILSFGLLIRFILGPLKTGAFIDEFYQLFSAFGILEGNGPVQVYVDRGAYNRGLYVSYLVSLSFKLFGKNLFAARLIPFFLGFSNLVLVYFLAKRIGSKLVAYTAVMVSSVEPMMIFIHTYVREYVFIQFFVLFSLLVLFEMREDYLRNYSFLFSKKTWSLLVPFLFFNIISCSFTNSFNKYSVILVILLFAVIFFLEKYWRKLKSLDSEKAVFLLLSISLITGITILKFGYIQTSILGGHYVKGISLYPLSFSYILVSIYGPFLIMFIVGVLISFKEKNREAMYLIGIFLSIYLLFEFLSFQKKIDGNYVPVRIAGRFIAFCLPIFFIIASKAIPLFFESTGKLTGYFLKSDPYRYLSSGAIIFLLISAAVFAAYPAPYDDDKIRLRGPKYKDWGDGTSYLKNNIDANDTVISIPAHGAEFYGPKPDYTIMTQDWDYANRTTGEKGGERVYLMTNTPVINSTDELNQILNKKKKVWIIYSSDYLSRWSNTEIVNMVKNKTKKVEASDDLINVTILVSK